MIACAALLRNESRPSAEPADTGASTTGFHFSPVVVGVQDDQIDGLEGLGLSGARGW